MKSNYQSKIPYSQSYYKSFLWFILIFCCLVMPKNISAQQTLPVVNSTILCDDFDGTVISPVWSNDASWLISNNSALQNSYGDPLLSVTKFNEPTYVIESTLSNLVTGYYRVYRLFFGVLNSDINNAYVFEIDAYGSEYVLSLGKSDGNYFYPTILDVESYPIDATRDYTFRLEKYENGLIQIFLKEGNGFLEEPILETIDSSFVNLGQFGWGSYTETADDDFIIKDICATVPDTQKTALEKSPDNPDINSFYTRDAGTYELGTLEVGAKHYTDRSYVVTTLPQYLDGATFIKTANNDKLLASSSPVLFAYFDTSKIAYVAYDPRGMVLPQWLQSWTKTDDVIGSTDIGTATFDVYKKDITYSYFYTGNYSLITGANLAPPAVGSQANYFVILQDIPESKIYEAELATLNKAVITNNQSGFSGSGFADYINPSNDYIEWDVNTLTPGNYAFKFRYALGAATTRTLELSINQVVVDTLSFESTSSWTQWVIKGNSGNMIGYLDEGHHLIRLKAIGSSGPNVDYLELAYTSRQPNLNTNFQKENLTNLVEKNFKSVDKPVIFPNPGSEELTIVMPVEQKNISIFIYAQGRIVYQYDGISKSVMNINSSKWNSGVYLFTVHNKDSGSSTNGKWIKN